MKLQIASSSKVGAWAELMACAKLMELGFEVFRNQSPVGAHDIVIQFPDTGDFLPLDVTLGRWKNRVLGTKVLRHGAFGKLKNMRCQAVLIVSEAQELFVPFLVPEKSPVDGSNIEGKYVIQLETATWETLKIAYNLTKSNHVG